MRWSGALQTLDGQSKITNPKYKITNPKSKIDTKSIKDCGNPVGDRTQAAIQTAKYTDRKKLPHSVAARQS